MEQPHELTDTPKSLDSLNSFIEACEDFGQALADACSALFEAFDRDEGTDGETR